jgi:hypothetical protein
VRRTAAIKWQKGDSVRARVAAGEDGRGASRRCVFLGDDDDNKNRKE